MTVPRPCPRCGTPVTDLDYGDVVRAFAGLPAVAAAGTVAEVHAGLRGAEYWLTFRTHTTGRCAAAAAGHPEPLTDPLAD